MEASIGEDEEMEKLFIKREVAILKYVKHTGGNIVSLASRNLSPSVSGIGFFILALTIHVVIYVELVDTPIS